MNNFQFQNPTELIFGKGQIAKISTKIPKSARVLITYGGGSIFKNGVYDSVKEALKDHVTIEFGGIEANPDYSTLCKAIELAKAEKVDFILAVGGGSVLDGTKFIAAAMNYAGDPWEFILDGSKVSPAMAFGSVLTLPATGSEMNCGAVISRRETQEKYAFHNPQGFPLFSVLDPEVCFSLPKRQVANGIVDIFAHTLEQYLTVDGKTMVMDRWAEGILQTLVELAPKLMSDKASYDDMANFMLAATMGLNGFIAMGTTQDWATHMIGHELTALHGLDHGVTLSIVYPGVMSVMQEAKKAKLAQYGERVWGVATVNETIAKTEEFFRSLGILTRLSEHNITDATIIEVTKRFADRKMNIGEGGIVTPDKVKAILEFVM